MTCPACGIENPSSALYCECGHEFVPGSKPKEAVSAHMRTSALSNVQKGLLAFALGVLSFPLFIGVGETLIDRAPPLGLLAFGLIMTAYFFVCQFMLSRGRIDAYRQQWPSMLALNAVSLFVVVADHCSC